MSFLNETFQVEACELHQVNQQRLSPTIVGNWSVMTYSCTKLYSDIVHYCFSKMETVCQRENVLCMYCISVWVYVCPYSCVNVCVCMRVRIHFPPTASLCVTPFSPCCSPAQVKGILGTARFQLPKSLSVVTAYNGTKIVSVLGCLWETQPRL